MSLVTRSREVRLGELLTIRLAAQAKGCSYDALRMWLRMNRNVPTSKVGKSVLVRLVDIEAYNPRGSRL